MKGTVIKYFGIKKTYNNNEKINQKICTFSTHILMPIAISIVSATILVVITDINNNKILQLKNDYDTKLKQTELKLQNKFENNKNMTVASKKIMNSLSELNAYILFELKNEVLNDIQELRLPIFDDTDEGLKKFKQIYRKNIHIIEQESIFLPKDLYQKTKRSIKSINDLMTLNLLIMYDKDFFEGFSIALEKGSQKVTISKETKNRIQEIINSFHFNFRISYESLQEEYRKSMNFENKI